jgi:hypothetical protein
MRLEMLREESAIYPYARQEGPREGLGARSDREKYASYSTCSIRNQKADDVR